MPARPSTRPVSTIDSRRSGRSWSNDARGFGEVAFAEEVGSGLEGGEIVEVDCCGGEVSWTRRGCQRVVARVELGCRDWENRCGGEGFAPHVGRR
jgi:hypothetical protein